MQARIAADAIPEPVRELCSRLAEAGHRAWVVGGCIRDLLRGREASDWDLATSAEPDEVRAVFRRTIPTGIEHGTITVLHRGGRYEVTTLRGEGAYSDGRRPDHVEFVSEIERDLGRRDFTVNAIAFDPLTEEIVDPYDGLEDLARGLVRAVRDPRERFAEDGLRVLRAARFCATLGFELEAETEAAIPGSLDTFRKVSPERVHDEWMKALRAPNPAPAFRVMQRTGMLEITCPPLAALDESAFARTLARVDACPREPALRLAALLYDIPASTSEERADWAAEWLHGLRASNALRDRVAQLLRLQMPAAEIDDADLRRFLALAGDAVDDVLTLHEADGLAPSVISGLRARIEAERSRGVPLEISALPIGGAEVMELAGLRPGPDVGRVLRWLLDRVLEEPERATREGLVALLPEALSSVRSSGPR